MDYFNSKDYVDYLIKHFNIIDDAASEIKRPDLTVVDKYVSQLNITKQEKILEIGCGLGRVLDWMNKKYLCDVAGIDVCEDAIGMAKKNLPHFSQQILCAPVEKIPFNDGSFDFVICWGVYDLTKQDNALSEMARVLKIGGKILLTGRNDNYHTTDDEAKIAEINIIKKGIPISYTDYSLFKTFSEQIGLKIEKNDFFEFRGDFAVLKGKNQEPERFYEYLAVLTKEKETAKYHQNSFYSKHSKVLPKE